MGIDSHPLNQNVQHKEHARLLNQVELHLDSQQQEQGVQNMDFNSKKKDVKHIVDCDYKLESNLPNPGVNKSDSKHQPQPQLIPNEGNTSNRNQHVPNINFNPINQGVHKNNDNLLTQGEHKMTGSVSQSQSVPFLESNPPKPDVSSMEVGDDDKYQPCFEHKPTESLKLDPLSKIAVSNLKEDDLPNILLKLNLVKGEIFTFYNI